MFSRSILLPEDNSFFLFGPRGVGKTTLLQERLPRNSTLMLNLLDYELESSLLRRPQNFSEIIEALPKKTKWVFIDEVQKLPFLLDEVHRHIEKNKNLHFALTGSSARKLKHGQANLLAGRAFTYHLAPLTMQELGGNFDLHIALSFGTLPRCITLAQEEGKKNFLRSYADTYLKEEIQSEGAVRRLPEFRQFLAVAGALNGQILSWSNVAQDVGISAQTVRSYFSILEDTLVGFLLPAFHRSLRKRQKKHPKFYWFDPGVARAIAGQLTVPLHPGTVEYGRAFEHFLILEIIRVNSYRAKDFRFSYFATHDIEIDLVIERPGKSLLFIEIKSTERIKDHMLRPLLSFMKDIKQGECILICREPRKRKIGNILICPWQESLQEIFA